MYQGLETQRPIQKLNSLLSQHLLAISKYIYKGGDKCNRETKQGRVWVLGLGDTDR